MASQVFSGTGQPSFTYTNNTGQNVRVVINFLRAIGSNSSKTIGISISGGSGGTLSLSYGGGTGAPNFTVGRNLAFYRYRENNSATGVAVAVAGNNAYGDASSVGNGDIVNGFPTELMLSSGQVFALNAGIGGSLAYNIVVIPEAG
jgi:hypothetical protein